MSVNNNTLPFQIGKSGVTEGTIDSLALAFKKHRQIRISVLKASGRTKETMPEIAEKITEGLKKRHNETCYTRIIGFTLILTKGRPQEKFER